MTEPVDAVSSGGDAGSKVQAQYNAYHAQFDNTDKTSSTKSSKGEAKFDKGLGLDAKQAKQFYANMCSFLVSSSKSNEKHMKEASADLKKAETGKV